MKILVLCNKSPWPAIEGGPMAMNSMIEGLIEAGHQVKVLAVNSFKYHVEPAAIPEAYRKKTGIELVHIDLRIKPLHAFFNLFTHKSYHVQRFISGDFRRKLIEVLQAGDYDIVQLETLFMAPYMPEIRKYSKAKVVLRAHNIEHLIWKRIAKATVNPLKRAYLNHLWKTLKRYEIEALEGFDGIAAITKKDAGFFEEHCSKAVTAIPFGVDPGKFETHSLPADFPSLYHIGAMNWMPNAEGVKWFLDEVWPIVNKQNPDLKCHLAGRYMPGWLYSGCKPNIVVEGEVPSAHDFIRSKGIAIVPLLSGSGIRIKIIESLALGKPVITTTIGAEGIDYTHEKNILIADSPGDFTKAINRCATDKEYSSMLGTEARKLIEETYDNRKIIERLTGFYRQIF